jgi:hypothetical protein
LSSARAVALAVAAAIVVSPAIPGPLGEPGRRLINADGDGFYPHWDSPLDGEQVTAAAERVPDADTYFVDAAGQDPVLQGNLKAAAQLYLAPARPVRSPDRADWILRYVGGRLVVIRGDTR